MITCFVSVGVLLEHDKHAWVIIIVGVFLVYKELTTSVVPKYADNNKPCSDSLILHNHVAFVVWFGLRFLLEPYMSESSDPHGYVVTASINCTNRWLYTANDIGIGKWGFHSCLESKSRISAETRPCATSLAFSPPCSHSISRRKHIESHVGNLVGRARLFSAWIAPFDCFSPSEWFTLCHGHGLWIWIIVKVLAII